MDIATLKAEPREGKGSARARRIRREGRVPCVLYGHGEEVVALSLSKKAVHGLLEAGHHVVSLDLGDRRERALVKEVQYDTLSSGVLHVDFSRVALDETVTLAVDLTPHGEPKAVLADGVLEQPLHEIEVACRADSIPDAIVVEVGHLETNEMIHVKDIVLPEGVTALTDAEAIAFVVHERREAPEEEEVAPAAAEAASAEPEVIRREAKPEGEESEKPEKS